MYVHACTRRRAILQLSMNEIDGGLPAMLQREKRSKATIPMVQTSSRSLIVSLAKWHKRTFDVATRFRQVQT